MKKKILNKVMENIVLDKLEYKERNSNCPGEGIKEKYLSKFDV